MKLKAAIVSLAMFATTAYAGETFFSVDVRPGPYMVYGTTGTKEPQENPTCYAEVNWRDGSKFQLIRDLHDGELYIFIRNNTWNIQDRPGKYTLRINFEKNGNVEGLNFEYNLVNKNTIVIRNIIKDRFLVPFVNANKMTLIMPGSIQNAEVDLTGSTRTVIELANCVERSKNVNLWSEGQPGTTNNSLDRI